MQCPRPTVCGVSKVCSPKVIREHSATYPVLVAVACEENVVVDFVVVQVLQSPVTVGNVALHILWSATVEHVKRTATATTHIPVVGTHVAFCVVENAREDDLVANKSPGGTALLGLGQRAVEPVLLARSHERTAGIVADGVNVVIVPT